MNTIAKLLLNKVGGAFNTPTTLGLPSVEKVDTSRVFSILDSYDYNVANLYTSKKDEIGDAWVTKRGKFTKRLTRAVPGLLELKTTTRQDCTAEIRQGFAKLFAQAREAGAAEVTCLDIARFLVDIGFWTPPSHLTVEYFTLHSCVPSVERNLINHYRRVDHIAGLETDNRLYYNFENVYGGHSTPRLTKSVDVPAIGAIGERITREAYLGGKKSWCVSLTDTIFWSDGNFGKDDSCWWHCYSESMDVFTDNDGLGLLWHGEGDDWRNGTARVWLAPLERNKGEALFLFNQYGEANDTPIRIEDAARFIVSILGEDEYRWLNGGLKNLNNADIPYINGNEGVFICRKDSAYQDGYRFEVRWGRDVFSGYTCERCGDWNDLGDEYRDPDGDIICEDCFNENCFSCDRCGETGWNDDVHEAFGRYYCETCFNRSFSNCAECGEVVRDADAYEVDGDYYCESCYMDKFTSCEQCGDTIRNEDAKEHDNNCYCEDCYNDLFVECAECGMVTEKESDYCSGGDYYCPTCFDELNENQEECNTDGVTIVTSEITI